MNELFKGRRDISQFFAMKLRAALGIRTDFWLKLQSDYNILISEKIDDSIRDFMHKEMISIVKNMKQVYDKVRFVVECSSPDNVYVDYFFYSVYHDSKKLDKDNDFYKIFYNLTDEMFGNSNNITLLYGKSYYSEDVIYRDIQ